MPFARRDIVCREAVELMTDYLEGALSRPARRHLERHLAGCPHCSEYLAQIRRLIAEAGRVEVDDLPPDAVDDLVDLYLRWQGG